MRGYIKTNNFGESQTADSDRRILDNLAGAGISSDISLFSNNLRNQSIITKDDYIFENNKFTITNIYMLPFANNTIVEYDENSYIVKNSNLTTSFQLYPIDNLNSPFIPTAPFKDITRNDSINFENISNLNPQRLQTKPPSATIDSEDVNTASEFNPYTYYGINENIDAIVQSVEMYEYKKDSSLVTDKENFVNSSLTVTGTITITNVDSNNNPVTSTLDVDNDPGMFVSNGTSKIRAFSDNSQPWQKISGGLLTNSTNTNVNQLVMSNPEINGLSVTSITTEQINTSLKNEYYSVPVTVNGETYYLLCKKVT